MGHVTDLAPAGLVPAAWLLTGGAHASLVTDRTLFAGLLVMDILLVAFAVAAREEMTGVVLPAWEQVLLAGLLANLLGTADMAVRPDSNPALPVTLYAWMLLPAVAYLYTGSETRSRRYRRVYFAAALLSILGTGVYSVPLIGLAGGSTVTLAGIAVLGAGQTIGIAAAATQNCSSRTQHMQILAD